MMVACSRGDGDDDRGRDCSASRERGPSDVLSIPEASLLPSVCEKEKTRGKVPMVRELRA